MSADQRTPGEILFDAIEEWRRDDLRIAERTILSDAACDLLVCRFNIKMAIQRERNNPSAESASVRDVSGGTK